MKSSSAFLVIALAAGGCGGGGSGGSTVRTSLLPAPAAVYCPSPGSLAGSAVLGWCGCSPKEETHIEISDWAGCRVNTPTVLQSVSTPALSICWLEHSRTVEIGVPPAAPVLYALGCKVPPATGSALWMFEPGGGSTPVNPTPVATLDLPVGQFGVTFNHVNDSLWLLGTSNALGEVRIYRVIDTNADHRPDEFLLFASLNVLLAAANATEYFAAAPFELRREIGEPNTVLIYQDKAQRLIVTDSNADGIADKILLPSLGFRPGAIVSRGGQPGSTRVLVAGLPASEVEVWLRVGGVPTTNLGTTTLDDRGSGVVTLSQALTAGEILTVKNVGSGAFGDDVIVAAAEFPTVVPLTSHEINVGGSLDVYIHATTTADIQAKWSYIDKTDWPHQLELSCTVTSLGGDVYRITFPSGVTNHFGSQQSLRVSVVGFSESQVLEVEVAAVP